MNEFELKFARMMFKRDHAGRRRLWQKIGKKIANGVPILNTIESLSMQRIKAGQSKHATTIALIEWAKAIQSGKRFSDAIDKWVTPEESMIISAGEQSGRIEAALESSCRIMESKKQIRGAIIGGVGYPFVLILMTIGVLLMFSYKIIPSFVQAAPKAVWTGHAGLMVATADFTRDWIIPMIAVSVSLIALFFYTLPTFDGKLRIVLDRYPPYSLYRVMNGASWLISFSALIEAGVRIEDALEQLARRGSPWLKRRMLLTLRGMRSGETLGDSLMKTRTGFPDDEIIDDIGVYAALSGFDNALSTMGREWITESVVVIQGKMRILFTVSIVMMAGTTIFMVSGLFAILHQLSSALKTLN